MNFYSLKNKIILSSIVCIFLVGIFSNVLLYRYLSGIISDKADELFIANSQYIENRINQNLMRFYNLGYTCANDIDVAKVLRYNRLSTVSQKKDGIKASQKLWGYLEVSSVKDYINKIIAFNEDGIMVQTSTKWASSQQDIYAVEDLPIFENFKEDGMQWGIQISKSIVNGELCFAYLTPVYDFAALTNCGWLYIEISSKWIVDEKLSYPSDDLFIVDIKGNILPSLDMDKDFTDFLDNKDIESIGYDNSVYKIRGAPLYIGDLNLVHCSDISYLRQDATPVFYTTIVVVVTSIMVAMMLSILLSNYITHPLKRLTNRIKKISENDFSYDPEIEQGNDEISQTGKMVNQMVGSIKNLLKETEEMYIQKKNSEINLLQSQVNPHFLYNTLDSIHWMATIQKNSGIMTMTKGLSSLLKNLAKGAGDKVTIEEELSLLKDYVDIQLIRYMEAFELKDNIDASFYKYKIVKFTLQPIVENAIFHGIEPKGEFGFIRVCIEEDDKDLFVTIEDNGVGMSNDELYNLQDSANISKKSNFSGIGISNVDNRIRLIYGKPYGLSIESIQGEFTKVTIRIPKEV